MDIQKQLNKKTTKYSIIKNEKNLSNHGIGAVWNEGF